MAPSIDDNSPDSSTNEVTSATTLSSNSDGIREVPIATAGKFFHDEVFRKWRRYFKMAVLEAVSRSANDAFPCGRTDREYFSESFKSYRRLRQTHFNKESQAVSVSLDSRGFMIVADVSDFRVERLRIRVTKEGQIDIEGRRKDNSEKCIQTFTFPRIQQHLVAAILSVDGVIAIRILFNDLRSNTRDNKANKDKDNKVNKDKDNKVNKDEDNQMDNKNENITCPNNLTSSTFNNNNNVLSDDVTAAVVAVAVDDVAVHAGAVCEPDDCPENTHLSKKDFYVLKKPNNGNNRLTTHRLRSN